MAKAGSILDEEKYINAAQKTFEFIENKLLVNNVLYHRYAKGEAAIEGFLDDYACLIYGLLHLYEATLQEQFLQQADRLAKIMIDKFWDQKDAGFYQTRNNESKLPPLKQIYDGAVPSGNSIAFYDLMLLSRLTNEPKYEKMATQMNSTFADEIQGSPHAFTFFLSSLYLQLDQSYSVVLVGDQQEKNIQNMLHALRKHYLPNVIVQLKSASKDSGYSQINGEATVYVCQNQTCLAPTNSIELMLKSVGVNKENIKS